MSVLSDLGTDHGFTMATTEGPIAFSVDTANRLFGDTTSPSSVVSALYVDDNNLTNPITLADDPVIVGSVVSQIFHMVIKPPYSLNQTSFKCLYYLNLGIWEASLLYLIISSFAIFLVYLD